MVGMATRANNNHINGASMCLQVSYDFKNSELAKLSSSQKRRKTTSSPCDKLCVYKLHMCCFVKINRIYTPAMLLPLIAVQFAPNKEGS